MRNLRFRVFRDLDPNTIWGLGALGFKRIPGPKNTRQHTALSDYLFWFWAFILPTLRVQVPNKHMRTPNLYHNDYYPIPKYLSIGYLDPEGYFLRSRKGWGMRIFDIGFCGARLFLQSLCPGCVEGRHLHSWNPSGRACTT